MKIKNRNQKFEIKNTSGGVNVMFVIDDLTKITDLVRKEHRKEINNIAINNFNEAEQRQIVELFRDLLYDELKYAMELMKFEREKEKYISTMKGSVKKMKGDISD